MGVRIRTWVAHRPGGASAITESMPHLRSGHGRQRPIERHGDDQQHSQEGGPGAHFINVAEMGEKNVKLAPVEEVSCCGRGRGRGGGAVRIEAALLPARLLG